MRWNNPYTNPPNGLPRVLGEWDDKHPTEEEFKILYPEYKLGCGYGSHISIPLKRRGKLREHIRIRSNKRRKKTEKMQFVRKNLPLFAEQIIKDEKLDWRAEEAKTV